MNAIRPYIERARNAFQNLTEREQRLIGLLGVVLFALLLFFLISSYISRTTEWKEGAQARRDGIEQLIAKRSDYALAMEEQKELNFKLDANPVSVPSFVERHSQALSIPAPTNFRDSRQPVGGQPDVIAISTEISFPRMSLAQLSDFARAVSSGEELLYIQRVQIREQRRGTDFEVTMQLTTYQNAPDSDEDDQ